MYSFFEKLIDPFSHSAITQPPNTFFAFCKHYTDGLKKHLAVMALLTSLFAILEVTLFRYLGKLVDWLATQNPKTFLQDSSTELIAMSVLVLVGIPVISFFQSAILHQTLLGNYPMSIRWKAHRYLLGQSLSFYQDEFAGRIATKVMQTALAVRECVIKILDVLLYVIVFFIGITLVVGDLEIRLVLPFLAWLALYILLLFYFLPRLKRISTRQADARSEMTGRMVDTYTNISTVKLFSHGRREESYVQESMTDFLATVHPQMRLATSLISSVWIINAMLIFSVVAVSLWLWSTNHISVGAIAVAVGIVLRLYGMSQWVMWEVSSLFEAIGTVQDGIQTLSQNKSIIDTPDAYELPATRGPICFKQLSFSYGKQQAQVIDQISFSVQPGEKIGLIGRSGAGKSTLMNLLLRFYDTESGTITIGDHDILQVTQDSLRAQIGMVTQDTSLLHRSIRENLKYGNPLASDEQMIEACQKAQAHSFILDLKDAKGRSGYDAHAGERGIKLSGGQRQRVAIARVLLKNAPILVLDEATSALDSEVEAAIQDSLYTLTKNKTVIAIAHRLSTISALDRLIVMDEGTIIEQGSHQQLIAQNGLYAQLWARQSGGFLAQD